MAGNLKEKRAGVRDSGTLFNSALKMVTENSLVGFSGLESFSTVQEQANKVFGGEGYNAFANGFKSNFNSNTIDSFVAAASRSDHIEKVRGIYSESVLKKIAKSQDLLSGNESFTLANFEGHTQTTKAVNIVLNTQSALQTKAAEEMYKTVSVKYEDEGIRISVRAAGVGSYVTAANAWESMTQLEPIFGKLRTGDIFRDDLLRVYPVFPEDDTNADLSMFVGTSIKAPTDVDYPAGDAYGRQSHLTQMLTVPCQVNNLLGLCTAPGQRGWTDTDDIESSSIRFIEVGATLTVQGQTGAIQVFVNTESMTNTTMAPTSVGQNSNDRDADITLRGVPVSTLIDDEGNSVKTLFQAYYNAGYEPNLQIRMTGRFNRQGYALSLTSGMVTIDNMTRIADNVRITFTNATDAEKALMRSLKGSVNAATPEMNLTNASNGNFGYRLEVYDTQKDLTTRRQDPVSVKYPVRTEDVNKEALDDSISYMGQTIMLKCSKTAHDEAFKHFDYLQSMDGAPVVDNNNGGNDLPGRMFCNVAALKRSFAIKDRVSSVDNVSIFDNICAVILNEVQDIVAGLEWKSGLAAINEYSGIDKTKWSVIVHQNLYRFMMRTGDARISASTQFEVIPSNFDVMIGKVMIIPANDSTEERINPLAGIGVNVAKENITLHGQVTRGTQDFGVMMTMPCYRHWNLNVLMGMLELTDAADFLDEQGMFYKLGGVAIKTNADQSLNVNTTAAGTSVQEVKIVNTAAEPVFTKETTTNP